MFFRAVQFDYSKRKYQIWYNSKFIGESGNEVDALKMYNEQVLNPRDYLVKYQGSSHVFCPKIGIKFINIKSKSRSLSSLKKEFISRKKKNKKIIVPKGCSGGGEEENECDSDDMFGDDESDVLEEGEGEEDEKIQEECGEEEECEEEEEEVEEGSSQTQQGSEDEELQEMPQEEIEFPSK